MCCCIFLCIYIYLCSLLNIINTSKSFTARDDLFSYTVPTDVIIMGRVKRRVVQVDTWCRNVGTLRKVTKESKSQQREWFYWKCILLNSILWLWSWETEPTGEYLMVGDGGTGKLIDFNTGYTSKNTGIIQALSRLF